MGFKTYSIAIDNKLITEVDKALINEDFKESDLKKVGTLISKMATRKLGVGAFNYIYSEKFKKSDGKVGTGAVFVSTSGVTMRYNYLNNAKKGYSVNSIDYWKEGSKLGSTPTKSISFEGENIVQLQSKLFEYLATGKLDESTDGCYDSIDELMSENSASEKKSKREAFAAEFGIKPSYTISYGHLKKAAIKQGLESEFYEALGGAIEVKSNVDEVTSTQKEWSNNQKKLGDGSDAVYADPKYVFTDMEEAAITVAKGYWRNLIIAGKGGLGKTYGVKQVLTQELGPFGEGPDGKWAYYMGLKASAFGLYKILLLNKKKLIVFDDSDSIWADKDMVDMMKGAMADDGERPMTWGTGATANVALMDKYERQQYENKYIESMTEDPNTKLKPPSKFDFEGQIIIISNMPTKKFSEGTLAPIMSRSIFIDLWLAQRDVLRRMATISALQGEPEDQTMRLLKMLEPDASDALEGKGKYGGEVKYITREYARSRKELNMRSLGIARALDNAGVKNLERMVGLYA